MKRFILLLLTMILLVILAFPMPAIAKTKWDLEGWRIDHSKWMDGLLFTYNECNWVEYRLEATGYNGVDTVIAIQHDYLDADGNFGIDGARDFFIGPPTDRYTTPGSISPIYAEGTVFDVTLPPTIIPVPNGYMLEYTFTITNPAALIALGDFAFYWEAHCSRTNSTGFHWSETIDFGSSYWSGASLHAHTSVTGNQDVPIKTPPQDIAAPSIDVEKNFRFRPGSVWGEWQDADNYPGPDVYCEVQYRFIVTNTGNVELTNITLSDTDPNINAYLSSIIIPSSLMPYGMPDSSFEVVTPAYQGKAGEHHNMATATGEYDGDPYSDTDHVYYTGIPK